MLPWALSRAGRELSGLSIQIEVAGAGEGTWHWGLGPGDVPSPRKTPDAVLRGRAPQFALVAGQRLSPDAVLEAGTVVLSGDRQLADVVLRTIRAYP
jgi:SCP-2 sterol transfer family